MKLYMAKAIGRGSTELAAFDAALVGAGVGQLQPDPPELGDPPGRRDRRGRALPVRAGRRVGRSAVRRLRRAANQRPRRAGLGRRRLGPGPRTGRGLFVEHEGAREQDVTEQITASLDDLQADPRTRPRPDPHLRRRRHVHRRPDLRTRRLRLQHRAVARGRRGRTVRRGSSCARESQPGGAGRGRRRGRRPVPSGHRRRSAGRSPSPPRSYRRVRSTSSRPSTGALLAASPPARWSVPRRAARLPRRHLPALGRRATRQRHRQLAAARADRHEHEPAVEGAVRTRPAPIEQPARAASGVSRRVRRHRARQGGARTTQARSGPRCSATRSTSTDALVFLAGTNVGAAVYEYGVARLSRTGLRRRSQRIVRGEGATSRPSPGLMMLRVVGRP